MYHKTFCSAVGATLVLLAGLVLMSSASAASTYKVLYTFTGGDDSGQPRGLTIDSSGNLYGTAYRGTNDWGAVFQLIRNSDGTWTHETLHFFDFDNGAWPSNAVILDQAGSLYGTAASGGAFGCGVVYKLSLNLDGQWAYDLLYSFTGASDGRGPEGPLVFDLQGNLYGTAYTGGDFTNCPEFGCGVVFKLAPNPDGSWTQSVIHSFTGGVNGALPYSRLVLDEAGNLYGTTTRNYPVSGTAFQLAPNPDGSWTHTVLHTFDNLGPLELVRDREGMLYGVTVDGGPHFGGIIFQMRQKRDETWKERDVHSFTYLDARSPTNLILAPNGNFYGTTSYGARSDCGTVFEMPPLPNNWWPLTFLYRSFGGRRGCGPASQSLLFDTEGNLYGASGGGAYGYGVIFQITP